MKALRYFKVRTKINAGYAVALILMVTVGSVAVFGLNRIDTLVSGLAGGLSQDQRISKDLVTQFLAMRYSVQQYINYQHPDDLDRYRREYAGLMDSLAQAHKRIGQAERVRLLGVVEEAGAEYAATFYAIRALIEDRNTIWRTRLVTKALQVEDDLKTLRADALNARALRIVSHADAALAAFLKIEVDSLQYLIEGDDKHAKLFEAHYKDLLQALAAIRDSLKNPRQQSIYNDTDTALSDYYLGFHAIRSDYRKQNELVSVVLKTQGDKILQATSQMAESINKEVVSAQQSAKNLVARTTAVVLGMILAAALLGTGLSYFVSKGIIDPLKTLTQAAGKMAGGDVRARVDIHSHDEIGELADTFNYMSARLGELYGALRESETRYRELFENSPVSLWEQDFSVVKERIDALRSEGVKNFTVFFQAHPGMVAECASLVKVKEVNNAALRMFGATSKAELMAGLGRLIPVEASGAFLGQLLCIAQGRTLYECDGVNLKMSGERIEVHLNWSVVPGYEDTLTKVLVSIEDITEHRRSERAIRLNAERTATLLKINQMIGSNIGEILQFAFDEAVRLTGSRIGYLGLMNEDETVLDVQVWSRGVMPDCAIDMTPLHFPVETGGLWAEAIRQRRPVITNDYGAPNPWKKGYPQGHLRIVRHMNIPVVVDSRIVIVAGVGNKEDDYDETDVQQLTLMMEGTFRIIQHLRAEEEIRRLNAELEDRVANRTMQLEAANKELEAFSYSVSHDLRAPLRSIDGFSKALLEDYFEVLDDQGKDFLSRVCNASRRMERLIDDMLKLSHATRGEMHRVIVDLSAMAHDTAAELKASMPERRVEFAVTEGLKVNADKNLMHIVLDNLLGNAWKFTLRHPEARIEVGETQHEGQKVYFVHDDGAGFDMAYARRLFGAFQRLHTSAEFEGSGIGLAIVQRIIHRHGGQVWAQSEVEKGTTVYFTIEGGTDS